MLDNRVGSGDFPFIKEVTNMKQKPKRVVNSEDNTSLYVTYINPIRFIVKEGETIDFPLEQINSLSYDHSLLCRIIGLIENECQGCSFSFYLCGDGAIGIKTDEIDRYQLVVNINDLFCKLYLGGFPVDAINSKDIAMGSIKNNSMIWPVNFGESLNSHLHAHLRLKTTGVVDAAYLLNPAERSYTLNNIMEMKSKGEKITNTISTLSTYHLLNGITEYKYHNWSSSLTFLWIVVEEIIDYLWDKCIIANIEKSSIYTKRKNMLDDHRTYTTSVKQEFLLQTNFISLDIYNELFEVRQARNKLIHEGKMITKETADKVLAVVHELLVMISGSEIETLNLLGNIT